MILCKSFQWHRRSRRAFTLVELLITVSIIGIMASMVLFAMFGAQESARKRKTEALIARLNAIIQAKWESYETRRIPINFPAGTTPQQAAKMRLDCLRDLMRLEMPDRLNDVTGPPGNLTQNDPATPFELATKIARPAVSQEYFRQVEAVRNRTSPPPPSETDIGKNFGAECLYMIVKSAVSEDGDGSDVFKPDSIGDTDNDGLFEFIDAWGTPIKFLRWAPGFFLDSTSGAAPETYLQVRGQIVSFTRGTAAIPGSPPTPEVPTTMTVRNIGGSSTSHFSQVPGSYVGARLLLYRPPPDDRYFVLDATQIAKVEQSAWGATDVTFSWAYNATYPFASPPSAGDKFAILKADGTDYRGVYPNEISFGLTPLIYSAGPNRYFGICADFSETNALRYVRQDPVPNFVNLSPFYIGTDEAVTPNLAGQIGAPRDYQGDPKYVKNGWTDNIHNQSGLSR